MSMGGPPTEPGSCPAPGGGAGEPVSAADIDEVLQDTATLWETIWKATGEYVALVDSQGIIRACNRVDDGFSIDQIVGHSLVRFTQPESSLALAETVRQVFQDGEMRSLETIVGRLDGGRSYFALRLAPIKREGKVVAAMVCCENIRPLKDTEQALTRDRNVLKRLLEIQERERQLISYEIHDGIAQYLAGAMMHFQAWEAALGAHPGAAELREGMQLLRAAADESRRLIGGLRPPALDELGIVEAIESLVADARVEVPALDYRHDLPGPRLPSALETTIFRIVQESLSNIRKHAAARTASVAVTRSADIVTVCVADDGQGFDPEAVSAERFGLEGIRQRSRLFGGTCRIESAPGQGTTVEVGLPVPVEPPSWHAAGASCWR
jgi:PAS domain S-box-containing protein